MVGKLCLVSTNKSPLISGFLESAHQCPTWGIIAAGQANARTAETESPEQSRRPGETGSRFCPLRFGGLMTILKIRGLLWRTIPTLGALVVRDGYMISLTRLNKVRVVINSDLIKFIEDTPDTVVTLVSGEKLVVAETVEEVVEKILRFRRQLMHWPESPRPLGAITSAHAENSEHTEE